MRDYIPPSNFPRGYEPPDWHFIPMDTPLEKPPLDYIIPNDVQVEHIPFGASSRNPLSGYNNKFGAELQASIARGAANGSGRAAATRKRPRTSNDPLFRKDPHAKTQAAVLAHLTDSQTACTAREIAEALGLTRDSIKTCLARLVKRGILKHRRFSLPRQRSGHQAQYILAELAWPPYPAGARVLRGQE